jgi:hypothetical protein
MDNTADVSRRTVLKGRAALAVGSGALPGCTDEELPEPVEYDELMDDLNENGIRPGHDRMDQGEFYEEGGFSGRIKDHDGDTGYFLGLHEVNELDK